MKYLYSSFLQISKKYRFLTIIALFFCNHSAFAQKHPYVNEQRTENGILRKTTLLPFLLEKSNYISNGKLKIRLNY
jgi:hypothetical protein